LLFKPAEVVMNSGAFIQDTIRQKIHVGTDSLKHLSDSASGQLKVSKDTLIVHHEIITVKKAENITVDTTAVCKKNLIADITFYDSANLVTQIDGSLIDRFPFVFTGMNRQLREETRAILVKHLKDGNKIHEEQYHIDWIMPVILVSAFIYAIVRVTSGNIIRGMLRFISFRGISESGSRDTSELFQWQSTLLNFASFINLSVFGYLTTIRYDFLFSGIHGSFVWLICLAILIVAVTIRHFLCLLTGKASGEDEIFKEYLVGIYQAYRMAGFLTFLVALLILYTTLFPAKVYFSIGFYAIGILYAARVLRLFLIFINRHVSIFYLILYLCALEILPVVILVKYVTGLV
jgi:hypothetical protein